MSEHKCVEWDNRVNRCVVCDTHYTDYVESLQAEVDELEEVLADEIKSNKAEREIWKAEVTRYRDALESIVGQTARAALKQEGE